jgi:putative ABC transport system substrate-binding protein
MKRREFITLIGGTAAAWPFAARAQQPGKLPIIGFLGTTTPSAWGQWVTAFVERLRELGWTDGRTVAIEYRWAEGRNERFADIAAEFVRLKVDVIVTSGGAVVAAKQATTLIPIVFAVANDPASLVSSLGRPGANVTGLSLQAPDLASKRLGLLREVLPRLQRLAILANVGYAASVVEMREVHATAIKLGLDAVTVEIRSKEDIAPALATLKDRAEALYVVTDSLVSTNQVPINTLALAAGLPTMHSVREYLEAGGFISYGPSYSDLFRRAGDYVDKILRGAQPGLIPVEEPTKFEFVINLKTARALGLALSESILARADEVIE